MSFALGGSGDVVMAPLPPGAAANVLRNHLVLTPIVSFLVKDLGVVTRNVVTRTPPEQLKEEKITIECDAQKWRGVKVAFRPRPGDHVAIRAPGNILRWFTVVSVEDRPDLGHKATCIDADQLDVETLALKITREFVRALRPIIALAGTCRMVGFQCDDALNKIADSATGAVGRVGCVAQDEARAGLGQVLFARKSLAAYIYERLANGIDDPTAAVNSIEWLRQKRGPNRVPDLGFVPLLNSVCTMAAWGFHDSTEDATELKPCIRFPEAFNAALTQLWHQDKQIRDALRAWAIALFYWRVSAKGGPGMSAHSLFPLGQAAVAAPPEVLSKIFLAMLGTALLRAKSDDQLGKTVAVQEMFRFFDGKTMSSYKWHHPLTPTAWKCALVVIEELEKTGIREPKSFGAALGHTCVPVHLWLCTAIGQVPAETIDEWFRRANGVGFRFLTPSDTSAREVNKLLMAHWWQPGIRSLLPRFARFANMVNDLFRKAALTATPPNEEPPLLTLALVWDGKLLAPSVMTTLPESKQQEYRAVQAYKEFNVRHGGWKRENGDQPFPVKAARELRLNQWNREPPPYMKPIPGWTNKKSRPPASEEEPSRKRRSDASGPEAKKKARARSEAGPAE